MKQLLALFIYTITFTTAEGQIMKTTSKPPVPKAPAPQPVVVNPPQKKYVSRTHSQKSSSSPTYSISGNDYIFRNALEKYEASDFVAVLELVNKLPENYNTFDVYELKAVCNFNLGNYDESRLYYQQIINKQLTTNFEDLGKSYFGIAQSYYFQYQNNNPLIGLDQLKAMAIPNLNQAVKLENQNLNYLSLRAKINYLLENWQAAITDFDIIEKLITVSEKGEFYSLRGIANTNLNAIYAALYDLENAKKFGYNNSKIDTLINKNPYHLTKIAMELYNSAESIAKYDSSLVYLNKAYLQGETRFSPFYIAEIYFHNLSSETKKIDKAERIKIAFRYFNEDVAIGGASTSFFHLGSIFEKGLGIEKDLAKAEENYKIGCDRGKDESCEALNKLKAK